MTTPTLRLEHGQSAMFGYGSLLQQRSMEMTLGKPYTRSRIVCSLQGWQRACNVFMPNTAFYEKTVGDDEFVPDRIIYLNVRPLEGASVNGLLYVVDGDELEAFDRREWIYDRLPVASAFCGVCVEGGNAYCDGRKLGNVGVDHIIPEDGHRFRQSLPLKHLQIFRHRFCGVLQALAMPLSSRHHQARRQILPRGGTKHIQPKTSVKDLLPLFLISTCNALPLDG